MYNAAISFHALFCAIAAVACALEALFMSSIRAAMDCGSAPLNMPAKPAKVSWDVTDGITGGPTAIGSPREPAGIVLAGNEGNSSTRITCLQRNFILIYTRNSSVMYYGSCNVVGKINVIW